MRLERLMFYIVFNNMFKNEPNTILSGMLAEKILMGLTICKWNRKNFGNINHILK